MSSPYGTPIGEAAGEQPETRAMIAAIGGVDAGIEHELRVLLENHVETFESCQGGDGHAYPEPTICFHGGDHEGFRVLALAMTFGLKVSSLRRYWSIQAGLPYGPEWQMTFWRPAP